VGDAGENFGDRLALFLVTLQRIVLSNHIFDDWTEFHYFLLQTDHKTVHLCKDLAFIGRFSYDLTGLGISRLKVFLHDAHFLDALPVVHPRIERGLLVATRVD